MAQLHNFCCRQPTPTTTTTTTKNIKVQLQNKKNTQRTKNNNNKIFPQSDLEVKFHLLTCLSVGMGVSLSMLLYLSSMSPC